MGNYIVLGFLSSLFGIGMISLLVCFYLLFRNDKVCKFMINFLNTYGLEESHKLPSYDEMLFSIKPLKEKHWIK